MQTIHLELSFSVLDIDIQLIGEDLLVTVRGGDKPHIGCAVLAVPRPSLKGDGETSCTSSVLNLTGHKDEAICRMLAEKACKKHKATCLCTGGFHVDNMSPEQIREVIQAVEKIEL